MCGEKPSLRFYDRHRSAFVLDRVLVILEGVPVHVVVVEIVELVLCSSSLLLPIIVVFVVEVCVTQVASEVT